MVGSYSIHAPLWGNKNYVPRSYAFTEAHHCILVSNLNLLLSDRLACLYEP
nr:MAG TPA: hypothetical protein [Crassvirales sp.]